MRIAVRRSSFVLSFLFSVTMAGCGGDDDVPGDGEDGGTGNAIDATTFDGADATDGGDAIDGGADLGSDGGVDGGSDARDAADAPDATSDAGDTGDADS